MQKLVVCLLVFGCLMNCGDKGFAQSANKNLPKPVAKPHDFGAFSFVVPKGWVVMKPDRDKLKSWLILFGEKKGEIKAMFMVDAGYPKYPTTQEMANSFVELYKGKVTSKKILFDGLSSIHVATQSKDLKAPKHINVILRKDRVYLVMVAGKEGVDVSETIAEIAKTWKWTPTLDSGAKN